MKLGRGPRCPASHRDFGPLAEQLARRAAEEAAEHAENPAKLLDAVTGRMEDASEEVYRARVAELLREVFSKLSPQTQWQILAERFDDETIRQALERERLEALAKLDPTQELQLRIQEARRTGHLNIEDPPEGTTLTVLLYVHSELFGPGTGLPSPAQAARVLFLRWNEEEAEWCVLREIYHERFTEPVYSMDPRDFIEIGTWYKQDEEVDVNVLHWGSALKAIWDDKFYTLKMKINSKEYQMFLGQCILNGTEVWTERPPGFDLPAA